MKTILYVLDYYLPHKGGVETVFEQIINHSLSYGYKVIIISSYFDKTLKQKESIGNLEIIRTGSGRKTFIRKGLIEGIKILRKNKNIFCIHTSTYGGAIPACILGLLFHKKVLLTVHEIFGKLWNYYKSKKIARLYRIFERIIFHIPFDKYHCVSFYTQNCLRIYYGIKDYKIFVAHNGIDYEFRDKNKVTEQEKEMVQKQYRLLNRKTLLYFGHTGISKGIDLLIESIPDILNINKSIQLIFNFIPAQRDTYIKNKINKITNELPENQKLRIQILSGLPKKELRALVSCVNGVIAPSISEGFGSVHTETLAIETPLITTHIASLPEVCGGNVLFFPPNNKEELCNQIKNLLNGEYKPSPKKIFYRDTQFEKILNRYKQNEN